MTDQQLKGRLQFLGLLVAFLVPLLTVVLMYKFNWMPSGSSYGTLVSPPRELNIPILETYKQKLVSPQEWRDKWHLVQVTTNDCDQSCLDNLHDMRQIHASLAKEISRLERVWLVNSSVPASTLNDVQEKYPDMLILLQSDMLARQFIDTGVGRMYLVDPLGKLMMRYPHEAESNGIRKDLMRLLRYSWAG